MRAWIVSDIHFSKMDYIWGKSLEIPQADVCICAGDVSNSISDTIAFLRHRIEPHMPIVLTLGNHDYYSSSIDFALHKARTETTGTRVHFLENERMDIGGCRFVGSTLWTDFCVPVGNDEHIPPEERRALAQSLVPSQIADFHNIFRSDVRLSNENGMVTMREMISRHNESRAYIDRELSQPFDGPTVVVTHHAPLVESFNPQFFGHITNAAFASDLSDLVRRRKPSLWVHGHIHCARDYVVDGTRVICNPRGYGNEREITGFQPHLVIDL